MAEWPKTMGSAFYDHSETIAEVIPADLGQAQHDALKWAKQRLEGEGTHSEVVNATIRRYEQEVGDG